jgi:opacity protein-like surface antigen
MVGTRLGLCSITAVALLAATAAHAADYSPPRPVLVPPPPVVDSFSEGWYLRGNVGLGINSAYKLEYLPNPANVGNGFVFEQNSNADTFFLGGGVGYALNNWLRIDGTAEYRARTQVNARGIYDPITAQGDAYQGYLKSWVFLTNAYVDLGTWNCFTPFVGAGVGAARNQLADFIDTVIGQTGHGFGRNTSEWHLAWALHAGVAYNVTKAFKVELAYRYLNIGSITDTIDCVGGCNPDSYKFSNLHSHDIMLGFRWTCCETPPPPPVVYTPPPLRSRG